MHTVFRRKSRSIAIAIGAALLALFGSLSPVSAASGEPVSPHAPVATSGVRPTPPPPPVGPNGVQLAGAWRGPYTFRNLNSGKCIDVWGPVTGSGAGFVQYTCYAGRVSQMFYLWTAFFDAYLAFDLIGNAFSGKCVDLEHFGRGAILVQYPCMTVDNQIWVTQAQHPNRYRNFATDLCMDVNGWSTADNAWIIQWDCHGGSNQTFLRYDA